MITSTFFNRDIAIFKVTLQQLSLLLGYILPVPDQARPMLQLPEHLKESVCGSDWGEVKTELLQKAVEAYKLYGDLHLSFGDNEPDGRFCGFTTAEDLRNTDEEGARLLAIGEAFLGFSPATGEIFEYSSRSYNTRIIIRETKVQGECLVVLSRAPLYSFYSFPPNEDIGLVAFVPGLAEGANRNPPERY